MDAIGKAVKDCKARIPIQILKKAFMVSDGMWLENNLSLEENITQKVIRERVIVDMDIVGGTELNIPLSKCEIKTYPDFVRIIKVPKALIQNRIITSVLSISYLPTVPSLNMGIEPIGVGLPLNSQANTGSNLVFGHMLNSVDTLPNVSSAETRLIADNVIYLKDTAYQNGTGVLRVRVSNTENLNNINTKSIIAFSKMVTFAVKAYIYNKLIIEIGDKELKYGQELGIFKTVLDSYSDAEENYQEFLETQWKKISIMDDDLSMSRYLRLLTSNNI